MAILKFLKNYNNYANRIIKHAVLVADIMGVESVDIHSINFNPADGITTEQIVNWDETWKPDYLIVAPDGAEEHYDPNYMSKYLNYVQVTDASSNVLYTASSSTPDVVRNQMITDGLMTMVTKAVNLYNLANYHNNNHTLNNMTFEGAWELDKFSLKIVDLGEWNFHIWSDTNDLTIAHSDFPSDGIVSKDFLVKKGWDITDTSGVLGFEFLADTPDAFNGEATFSDFVTKLIIDSRWFVIDFDRKRAKQYNATLKQDVIADNYEAVINSPALIERAIIDSKENPLLYNPEGFSFNQIKQDERLLTDLSQIPWYVLYFKKDTPKITGSFSYEDAAFDVQISTPIANSTIYSEGTKYYVEDFKFNVRCRPGTNEAGLFYSTATVAFSLLSSTEMTDTTLFYSSNPSVTWFSNNRATVKEQLKNAFTPYYNNLKTTLNTELGYTSLLSTSEYNTLNKQTRIRVKDSDDKIWNVTITKVSTSKKAYVKGSSSPTKTLAINLVNSTSLNRTHGYEGETFQYEEVLHTFVVGVSEATDSAINWTIDFGRYEQTLDSDFNIIAVPYSDIAMYDEYRYDIKGSTSKSLVESITQVAGDNLVDIQLMPYCPIQEAINTTDPYLTPHPNSIIMTALDINLYDEFLGGLVYQAFILYVPYSNFTFNIPMELTVPEFTNDEAINYKISNECDLYKIVSPNYNGSFEFSIAKNDGVDLFNIDVTLIPYNPYIHINPNFKALYGADWDDSKGLLCGGDFSLPKYSDAWVNYELQNKNYQQIFDRQIRNLDFTNKQEQIASGWQIATGTVQGTIQGGMAGGMTGNPYVAAAGAIIGGGSSLAGGIGDALMLAQRQSESKSLMLDNYRYQLGNIKALPDTINKTTPLTYNNKKFPFLEIYSSTDTEKFILSESIRYKSMNVNAIGTISDYIKSERTFIKATPLRIEGVDLSAVEMLEIFNELNKGVYI